MKKRLNLVFVIALTLTLFLFNTSTQVSAKKDPDPVRPGLADGSWSAGSEIQITLNAEQYPGLQLLTNGVKISEPAKLCHEFRGGDYGWVGEIRILKNNAWVKQPTTTGWVPDSEGAYMACTDASTAGTYALFGWYDAKKARPSSLPACNADLLVDSGYYIYNNDGIYTTSFSFLIPSMTFTSMSLSIVEALGSSHQSIDFNYDNFDANEPTDKDGGLSLTFLTSVIQPDSMHVILTTPTCYFDIVSLKHMY